MTDRQYRNRIQKINALNAEVARLKAQVTALQDEIKVAMGDTEQYTTEDGYNIFWAWKKGKTHFDDKAFGKEYPDLFQKFTVTDDRTRAFRITKPKVTA